MSTRSISSFKVRQVEVVKWYGFVPLRSHDNCFIFIPLHCFSSQKWKRHIHFLSFHSSPTLTAQCLFCIAFSIKQFLPLEHFSHWHNAKMKVTPVTRFPGENCKKIEVFFILNNENKWTGIKMSKEKWFIWTGTQMNKEKWLIGTKWASELEPK